MKITLHALMALGCFGLAGEALSSDRGLFGDQDDAAVTTSPPALTGTYSHLSKRDLLNKLPPELINVTFMRRRYYNQGETMTFLISLLAEWEQAGSDSQFAASLDWMYEERNAINGL